jgi:hypothetical protein
MGGAPRVAARNVDRGAYRPSLPDSPPKVHLKNLGTNEAFDKKQMHAYLRAVGETELNAFFHLLDINSKNSRLI